MDKYLKALNKIKACQRFEKYFPELEKVELYIKGKITPQELLASEDDNYKQGVIYYTINKVLNYEERDVRYYIELPQNMFFGTGNRPCILAGRVKEYEPRYNEVKLIGPKYQLTKMDGFFDNFYTEITGDFSQYPEGVMLFPSDWYRIISKYPYIHERMYNLTINDYEMRDRTRTMTREQIDKRVDEEISIWINKPKNSRGDISWCIEGETRYLPQEVIDSIKFVIPKEYLPKEQFLAGNFGTFEEIANGIEKFPSKLTNEDETKKLFKSVQSSPIVQTVLETNELNDDVIKVELGDVIDYIKGPCRKYMAVAIDLDIKNMTEESIRGSSQKELLIMLLDFVLNYKGKDAKGHLAFLTQDSKILNGRVCDIPVIEFAKLNSSEIVSLLSQLGAENIKSHKSKSKVSLIITIASILGYGQERKFSMDNAMDVIKDMLKLNTEEQFKRNRDKK